jgi:UDP-2,3-diacylglucosamine pyrophosphatase LpxH
MQAVVISDIHIGSRYSRFECFKRFVDGLPEETELILNGDVVDKRFRFWRDREMINFIKDRAKTRRIVWVYGNHDVRVEIEGSDGIVFKPEYALGRKLYISHGHKFEKMRLWTKPFAMLFYLWYQVHFLAGGPDVHVAYYAKRYPRLYRVMTKQVAKQAVCFAKLHGYSAVTCGHTHFAEDVTIDGIRYINTGAWTEQPSFFLELSLDKLQLVKVD